MRSRLVFALLPIALLMTGCPGSSLSIPEGDPTGPPSEVVLGSDCDNEAAVVTPPFEGSTSTIASEAHRTEVLTLLDPAAAEPCRAFLVYGRDGRYSSTNIAAEITPGFGFPKLIGLADLNGDALEEAIVLVQAGASTQFALIFELVEGGVREVVIEGDPPYGNLIGFGGSVGHLDGAACVVDSDQVVLSSAVPKDAGYRIERRYYALEAGALVPAGMETDFATAHRLNDLPDFAPEPFGNCN